MIYTAKLSEDKYVSTFQQDTLNTSIRDLVDITVVSGDHYEGTTTITPNSQIQTLQTVGLVVDSNIIINPIPSNYGVISWNGSVLTVS